MLTLDFAFAPVRTSMVSNPVIEKQMIAPTIDKIHDWINDWILIVYGINDWICQVRFCSLPLRLRVCEFLLAELSQLISHGRAIEVFAGRAIAVNFARGVKAFS